MNNYIVRIYRRDPMDPEKVTGMVECVERDERRNFSDFNELRAFIGTEAASAKGTVLSRKTGKRGRKP